jgi:1-acyl-sn-glycerol-3-phosphate acyltransferase
MSSLNLAIINASKNIIKIFNSKVSVKGQYNLQQNRNHIIVCNHTSIFDIPASYATFNKMNVRMIARSSLFKIPILSGILKAAQTFSLNRKNNESALKDLQKVENEIAKGQITWICPEGTRSVKLTRLKKGAFMMAKKTEAIILPIYIKYHNKVFSKVGSKIEVSILKSIDSNKITEIAHMMKMVSDMWQEKESNND